MADTRIAYGLAKKHGIDTTGMSPKEVWDALKEKGISLGKDSETEKERLTQKYGADADYSNTHSVGKDSKQISHRDIPSGTTKERFVAKELGVDVFKAKEYADAIYSYTLSTSGAMRKYQQGGEASAYIRKIERDIEEYIAKAPKWNGGETVRGIGLTDDELSEYSVGSIHDMRGTSSWSSEIIIAQEFADWEGAKKEKGKTNAVIFHSPTQHNGTSIRHLSNYPNEDGENEVIVSKQSRYKVVRRSKDNDGRVHIFLEEEQ